jgi:hypothetical protein
MEILCIFTVFCAEKLLEKNLEIDMFINQYEIIFFQQKIATFVKSKT